MLDFLFWVLNRQKPSADTARNRLHAALMQDRVDLAPELLESLKQEILAVVSQYMVVGEDFHEFELRRMDEAAVLVSNIRVKELKRWATAH